MNKLDYIIQEILEEQGCHIIEPSYKYEENSRNKIVRDISKLLQLETFISKKMKETYQKSLLNTLEEIKTILHIDCQGKGENFIMVFILKEYAKISKSKKIEKITREAYSEQQDIKLSLQKIDPRDKNMIISFKNENFLDGLGELMKDDERKYLYIYLDNVEYLDDDEQKCINKIISARGEINNGYIRLKINNGSDKRRNRKSITGHTIQSPHDYKNREIKVEDIK